MAIIPIGTDTITAIATLFIVLVAGAAVDVGGGLDVDEGDEFDVDNAVLLAGPEAGEGDEVCVVDVEVIEAFELRFLFWAKYPISQYLENTSIAEEFCWGYSVHALATRVPIMVEYFL